MYYVLVLNTINGGDRLAPTSGGDPDICMYVQMYPYILVCS